MIWQSESIKELAAALSKFQGEVENARKTASNPHFRSKYADLAEVWDTIRVPLAHNGLSVVQLPCEAAPGHIGLTTMVLHASGEWLRARMEMKVSKDDPQGHGSAYTYAKRYALTGLGVASEDDDANAASLKGSTNVRTDNRQPTAEGSKAGGTQAQGSAPVGSAARAVAGAVPAVAGGPAVNPNFKK